MRIPKSLAGLLVGAAMSFLAPAARAEFSMQIVDNKTGNGFKIQENATHTAFALQTLGSLQATFSLKGGGRTDVGGGYLSGGLPQHYLTGATNVLGGSNQSSLSNQVMVPPSATPFALTGGSHGPQYALSDLVTLGMNGHVGTSNFWSQSAVAMPEPTGIIIGLLGVPCVAGLVLLSRRQAVKVPAVA